ncbi:hypothetical protein [Caulobacter sp. NIBR1757]|uniref:hypothetical protein n=1 Tax=Caulobacter sp. NIBR1757 TaxID=3016000 RepID=UPI0022F05E57|nr:hypothetical protein [Caulobacter sp. NIBR1757]
MRHDPPMPLPGLFGLVLISFVLGALAALATGRRRSAFTGTAAALAGGLAAPWLWAQAGWPVTTVWMVLGAAAASAVVLTGLAALLPRR